MSLIVQATENLEIAEFDYSRLPPDIAKEAKASAARFRAQYRRVVSETIEIGQSLLAVKDGLDHGLFGEWLNAEFGGDARTAQNYMTLAREYGGKAEIISDLPLAVAYKLASPSVPNDVRQQVEAKVRGGEPVTAGSVRQMMAEGIEADRERRAKEREAERRSKLSEQQLKDEDRKVKARVRSSAARAEAARAERAAMEAEDKAQGLAEARLASFIVQCVGARRGELVGLLKGIRRYGHPTLRIALGGIEANDLAYSHREKDALDAIGFSLPSAPSPTDDLKRVWGDSDQETKDAFAAWLQKERPE